MGLIAEKNSTIEKTEMVKCMVLFVSKHYDNVKFFNIVKTSPLDNSLASQGVQSLIYRFESFITRYLSIYLSTVV